MKTKILLVDDEKDIVEFLQYNLSNEGFKVITAFNGQEALDKLSQKPDLIILDVMMPKMDGYEACGRIRAIDEFKNTPVIFLTAKSSELDEVHGLNIGADDFIQKPISPKKLIARVKSNLRKIESAQAETVGESEIVIGPLVINRDKYEVTIKGKLVFFPKKTSFPFIVTSYLSRLITKGPITISLSPTVSAWADSIFLRFDFTRAINFFGEIGF